MRMEQVVLDGQPQSTGIDVTGAHVADADGANSLAVMERMVCEAAVTLQWWGLDEPVLATLP
jgi:hypothetical protein